VNRRFGNLATDVGIHAQPRCTINHSLGTTGAPCNTINDCWPTRDMKRRLIQTLLHLLPQCLGRKWLGKVAMPQQFTRIVGHWLGIAYAQGRPQAGVVAHGPMRVQWQVISHQ